MDGTVFVRGLFDSSMSLRRSDGGDPTAWEQANYSLAADQGRQADAGYPAAVDGVGLARVSCRCLQRALERATPQAAVWVSFSRRNEGEA